MSEDLRHWLAQVCRERRDDAGLVRASVAGQINISEERIKRFETGVGLWPPRTGDIVQAYATATGTDAPDLWIEAVTRWRASLEPAAQQDTPRNVDRAKALATQAKAAAHEAQTRSTGRPRRAGGRG